MGFIDKKIDLIDDAYKNYSKKSESQFITNEDGTMTVISPASHYNFLKQEEFINKIKTDDNFAKRWGITIETRELSEDERINLLHVKHGNKGHHIEAGFNMLDEFDIPTKLITIIYNNETIESYE